jgi:hypothetical protein
MPPVRGGDNPSHLAKSESSELHRTITPSQIVRLEPCGARRMPFPEFKSEILVTSSSNASASVSAPRKSLTIIQTLVIVGTAGLIGSLLVKLLV